MLKPDNRPVLSLWLVVIVSYMLVTLFAAPLRLLRFSAAEQQAIFGEIADVICSYELSAETIENGDIASAIDDIMTPHQLAASEVRYLYRHALNANWDTPPCMYYEMSRFTCPSYLAGAGLQPFELELRYKFNQRQIRLYTQRGAELGVELAPCYQADS